jgi:hypothetical protein
MRRPNSVLGLLLVWAGNLGANLAVLSGVENTKGSIQGFILLQPDVVALNDMAFL